MKHVHIYSGGGLGRLPFILRVIQRRLQSPAWQPPKVIVATSAGAIAAALVAQGVTSEDLDEIIQRLGKVHPFNARRILEQELKERITSNRPVVEVVLQATDLSTGRRVAISAWDCQTLDDYHQLILGSCNVPIFMGAPSEVLTVGGEYYADLSDGGVWDHLPTTAALPHIDADTILTTIQTQALPRPRYHSTRLGWQIRQAQLVWGVRAQDDLSQFPRAAWTFAPRRRLPPPWAWGRRHLRRTLAIADDATQ